MNSRCRLRSGFRLGLAGVLALAFLPSACSGGTDVTAEVDAAVAATVEAVRSIDEAVAATVEANQGSQPAPTATAVPMPPPLPAATPVPTATPVPAATPPPATTSGPAAPVVSTDIDSVLDEMLQDPQLSLFFSRNTLLQHGLTICAIAARVENINELIDELFPNGYDNPSIIGVLTLDQASAIFGDFAYSVCPQDANRVFDVARPEPNTPTIQDDVRTAIQRVPELAYLPESTIIESAYVLCSIAAKPLPLDDLLTEMNSFRSQQGLTIEQNSAIFVSVSQWICPEDFGKFIS